MTRLRRYMTPAGYDLAVSTFGAEGMADAVAEHGEQLRLAAAELLEGLPSSSEGGGISSFKLDVLEFKFRDNASANANWAAIAARLREQEAAANSSGSAMFIPTVDEWGVQ